MKSALTLALLVGLALCAGRPAIGQPRSPRGASFRQAPQVGVGEQRAAARTELLAELLKLGEWCTKKKVFACRAEVFDMLLRFDSENEAAKRGLGYKKQRDGSWQPDERKRPPKNFNRSAQKKFPAKLSAVTQSYKDQMLALLDSTEAKPTPSERLAILEDLLFADPDDGRAHAERGEVKLEDKWVLAETARAKQQRVQLKDMVRKAFGTLPEAKPTAANAKEAAFPISWKGIYASPIARSLSTGSKQEAERLTQAMWAARSYFRDALSTEASLPKDLTVYTFGAEPDRDLFLQNHPGIDKAYRETLMFYDGSGIAGTGDFAHWAPEPDRRLDGLVRQAITWMFAGSFKIFPKHGWIFEGFGIYMTRELVGTRLTWYVRPEADTGHAVSTADLLLHKKLLDTRTNWMAEANKILQTEKRPKLQFLLGKDVNQLNMDDMLYSYVLAAYLIEAEAENLPVILTKIGEGLPSIEVLEDVLGMDIERFDSRVRRWLQERL